VAKFCSLLLAAPGPSHLAQNGTFKLNCYLYGKGGMVGRKKGKEREKRKLSGAVRPKSDIFQDLVPSLISDTEHASYSLFFQV